MASMLLIILKVVAGFAALAIISFVLIAVVTGLWKAVNAFGNRGKRDGNSGGS